MKLFYRNTECNFREFISAYLACAVGYATTDQALSLSLSLLTQYFTGAPITGEQRAQVLRDTGGSCMIEFDAGEFMTGRAVIQRAGFCANVPFSKGAPA